MHSHSYRTGVCVNRLQYHSWRLCKLQIDVFQLWGRDPTWGFLKCLTDKMTDTILLCISELVYLEWRLWSRDCTRDRCWSSFEYFCPWVHKSKKVGNHWSFTGQTRGHQCRLVSVILACMCNWPHPNSKAPSFEVSVILCVCVCVSGHPCTTCQTSHVLLISPHLFLEMCFRAALHLYINRLQEFKRNGYVLQTPSS